MATANLDILIAARDTAQAELARLNASLRQAGSTTKITATSAGELMRELRGAEKAQREIDRLDRYIKMLGDDSAQSGGKLSRMWASIGIGGNLRIGQAIDLGPLAGFAGAIGAAGLSLNWAKDRIGEAMDNASALNETMSKSAIVFGQAAAQVEQFGNRAAVSLGMSEQQAVEAAASIGNLFLGAGIAREEAARLSTSLVQLAGDLASFNNISSDEALQKLRSGLVGEAEPLRTLGVLLSESAVQARALSMGLAANAADLTEAQKVQARYALIMEQTTTAQGDFARTADGAANAGRKLDAQMADLSASFGALTLPIRTGVITALSDLLRSQEDMRASQQRANEMIAMGAATADAYAQAAREVALGLDGAAAAADRAARGIRGANSAMTEFLDEAPVDVSRLAEQAAAASDLADAFVQHNSVQRAIESRRPLFTPQEQAEASDLADSYNRVQAAAGLMAEAENRAEIQARSLADAKQLEAAATSAASDAEREHARAVQESVQRAQSAVQGLQSSLADLSRTPLAGQGAFDATQATLQERIAEIDLRQKQLAGSRAGRAELRGLARERLTLEQQLAVSQAEEIVRLGPQQRELDRLLNPPLPEMSLDEIARRAAGARAGLAAAEAYQQTIQQTNNVTVNVDAGGHVSVEGDEQLGRAIGEAVQRALAQEIAGAGRSSAGASPSLAGTR